MAYDKFTLTKFNRVLHWYSLENVKYEIQIVDEKAPANRWGGRPMKPVRLINNEISFMCRKPWKLTDEVFLDGEDNIVFIAEDGTELRGRIVTSARETYWAMNAKRGNVWHRNEVDLSDGKFHEVPGSWYSFEDGSLTRKVKQG